MTTEASEYKVLARKYRPKTFDELIGQNVMVKTLTNAILSKRLAHAFILTGVRGVGKTTTARLLASTLNCLDTKAEGDMATSPCGKCENCLEISESRHPDVLEMDAASRTSVDDVREIIENVRYAPTSARFKVYIIDEVHMLSKSAFNALLKTLEEPPPHVKFIFATTEIRKLPVTVLSRCQRFDLRRVSTELLVTHLRKIIQLETCEVDDAAISMIARAAEGSVRDALSLLDQAIAHGGGKATAESVRSMLGLADRSQVLTLFRNIMTGDVKDALDLFQEQYNLGADPAVVLKDLVEITHWVSRIKTTGEAGTDVLISEPEKLAGENLAKSISLADLTRAWQLLLKGFGETQTAPSPIHSAEMVIIRLCYAARLPDPGKLVKTLTKEKQQTETEKNQSDTSATTDKTDLDIAESRNDSVETITEKSTSVESAEKNHGNVLALAKEPVSDNTLPSPMPQSFQALVSLFESKHEGVIGKYLFDDVSLVSYKPGAISFKPLRNIPTTLPSRMKDLLKVWTGQTWQITLTNEEGEQPLQVQEQERNKILDERAQNSPLVKKVLAVFPDAKIKKIRPLNEDDET